MDHSAARSTPAPQRDESLGARLRRRRKAMKLTMQEVADGAGLSVGFISQIERGLATPSLSSLVSVARVLRTEVSRFLDQPRGESSATRSAQRPIYAVGDNALTYERLSASFPGNVLRSLIIHEPPGHRTEPISHEGEEMFFILDGAITVEVEGARTILEKGDSIHFPSTIVHSSWNHTGRPATILHTCTMDVFGDGDGAPTLAQDHAIRRGRDRVAAVAGTPPAAGEQGGATPRTHPDNREEPS